LGLNHIALFAGVGGDTLAAQWAGFETVLFVEIDKFCQKVLNKHWPDVPIIGDIHDVKGEAYKGTITLITGGFPCQPVSVAGKQRGKEDDRWLWPEMLRVISEIRPTWVVAENVAGLLRMGFGDCISDLESAGYETTSFLIPACAVNAPHRRDRVFIVGYSKDRRGQWESRTRGLVGSSQDVVDTSRKGFQDGDAGQDRRRSHIQSTREGCRRDGSQWAVEPDVGRVASGVPSRVDRLKGLGNAIVPQQIYPILKGIAEIERNV